MRLAYYVPASLLRHAGIQRRAGATAEAWRAAGHDVVEVRSHRPEPRGGGTLALARWERACDRDSQAQVRGLAAEGALDQVHLRLFVPGGGWASLATRTPTSLEVHALLDRPESARDAYRVVAGALPARRLVGRAAAAVFVTAEMAQRFGGSHLRRTAIGNGVVLGEVVPAPGASRPRIGMAVGSRGSWHGLDRLAALATAVPEAQFVVVVPTALEEWARASLNGGVVTVLPSRDRGEYDELLAALDGTLGTLALDRRGLTEAAPLKVRDSVAAGVPVALPYRDTNLDGAQDPAVTRFDPRDPSAAAAAVRAWLTAASGARVSEATRSLVDLTTVEESRLRFLLTGSPGATDPAR